MPKPKLLLADDSPTIRKVVELTFADEGIQVTSAADSTAAMECFVEIQPDIVLVDASLDGTSGYQICEMIKADEATAHIPVLLLIGSFEPFDQDEAERVGADGFITKPFASIRDLVSKVFELIGKTDDDALPDITHLETVEFRADEVTADIEELYNSSFAETAEIEHFETVEDLLRNAELDDELIEATFPTAPDVTTEDLISPFLSVDEPEDKRDDDVAFQFDWSPEAIVGKEQPAEVAAGFEPKFLIEETVEKSISFEMVDESPTETNQNHSASNGSAHADISPEMIERIVNAVVEKMSDKVVREIAKQCVPEIAEKLIREALEEDKTD